MSGWQSGAPTGGGATIGPNKGPTIGGHRPFGYKPHTASTGNVDIGWQRAAQIADKFGPTYMIFSFAARDGGAHCAKSLRTLLMQKYQMHQPNNVYIDSEALADVPGTALKTVPHPENADRTVAVASLNDGWRAYYRYAMQQASVIIFIADGAWCESKNCQAEYDHYQWLQGSAGKPASIAAASQGGAPYSIALRFPDCRKDLSAVNKVIEVQRQHNLSSQYGDWSVNDTTFGMLIKELESA